MNRARRTGLVGLAILLATARITTASDELSRPFGTFTMESIHEPGQVILELRRTGSRGSRSVMSHVCSLGDLRPLSMAELNGSGAIRFTLGRDAGTLVFEGEARGGVGYGRFAFEPNEEFLAFFRAKGLQTTEDDVFAATIHDVNRAFLEEMAIAGYPGLAWEMALSFRIQCVSREWINALAAQGVFPGSAGELVALRVRKVSPAFVMACREAGIRGLDAGSLVSLKVHRVTPDDLAELVRLGYAGLHADDVVAMRLHGVNPDFIRSVNEGRSAPVPVEDLLVMKIRSRRR